MHVQHIHNKPQENHMYFFLAAANSEQTSRCIYKLKKNKIKRRNAAVQSTAEKIHVRKHTGRCSLAPNNKLDMLGSDSIRHAHPLLYIILNSTVL